MHFQNKFRQTAEEKEHKAKDDHPIRVRTGLLDVVHFFDAVACRIGKSEFHLFGQISSDFDNKHDVDNKIEQEYNQIIEHYVHGAHDNDPFRSRGVE